MKTKKPTVQNRPLLMAKNIREWFAFYGGEELGVSLEHASIVWDAATKAAKEKEEEAVAHLKGIISHAQTPDTLWSWIYLKRDEISKLIKRSGKCK